MRRYDRNKEAGMRKILGLVIVAAFLVVLVSCMSVVYSRDFRYRTADKDVEVTEVLTIAGSTFKLEKQSDGGVAMYEGKFQEQRDTWIFKLDYNKPANGIGRVIDPPIRYEYQVTGTPDGVRLDGPKIKSRAPSIPFLSKGDFVRQR